MAFYNKWFDKKINEAIAAFANKETSQSAKGSPGGEGIEDLAMLDQGYGQIGTLSLNRFYNRYINKIYQNEYQKIIEYRRMSESPEISDVIEDAVNEATQTDETDTNVITLSIKDEKLEKNENIKKTLYKEFEELFYNRININNKLWDYFRSFLVDGRLYYERILSSPQKDGIKNIKKLPAETMDMEYDMMNGKITVFYQYLSPNIKRPQNRQIAEQDKHKIIIFEPSQIGYINYGVYGTSRYDIYGYLEKVKVPYNQLKLLETSVIIYRIVRSPERLVFKIDTGSMPRDKAFKFAEKVKSKFIKKQSYDPTTGKLTAEPEVLSILENFFIPVSSEGRGSSIDTIGGNAKGFTELDDVYYFAKKMYLALKYPMSRIEAASQGQSGNIIFGGGNANQITRDEIKWAKFLERQQILFCNEFRDLFLLHLDFRGIKQQYGLNINSFQIKMTPPSHYRKSMEQSFLELSFNNYNALSNNAEFSKYFLIKRYLGWTDDDLKANKEGFKMDKKLMLTTNDAFNQGMGGEGGAEGEYSGEEEMTEEDLAEQ